MNQGGLFDGLRGRDAAMANVARGAGAEWAVRAHEAVVRTAREMDTFTSDDVWERMPGGAVGQPDPRAMGPVIVNAVRLGVCRRTGQFTLCRRASRHAAPVAVWASCLRPKGDE